MIHRLARQIYLRFFFLIAGLLTIILGLLLMATGKLMARIGKVIESASGSIPVPNENVGGSDITNATQSME